MTDEPIDRRALYLRWRPRVFADVVGQDHVVQTLRNAVTSGAPAHAYLLTGPRGTGKTSIARILHRAVNCESTANGDPCGHCGPCRAALDGRTLDLVEIDAASNRGIDDIRDLREKVAFSPSDGQYRVYIVDEAHELTAPAWDAFLKTLEEPPPHAIFVLATTEAHRIPATIVSRCQRFDLRRIRPDAIASRLLTIATEEGIQLDAAAADRLARMSRGGLRDAISLLDQAASFSAGCVDLAQLRDVLGLADPRSAQELMEAILDRNAARALDMLSDIEMAGSDLRVFADEVSVLLRGLLFAAAGATRALAGELSAPELQWLNQNASRLPLEDAQHLLRAITETLARTRDSRLFQLQLELAVLQACGSSAQPAAKGGASPDPAVSEMTITPAFAPTSKPFLAESPPGAHPPGGEPTSQIVHATIAQPEAANGEIPAPEAHEQTSAAADELAADSELLQVRQSWGRVVEWVRNRNAFVASYLGPAEVRDLRDGWLHLRLAFKVHHQRVSEAKNRSLVEQACQEILGRSVRLRCEHVPPSTSTPEEVDLQDPVVKFALERFGGRAEYVDSPAE